MMLGQLQFWIIAILRTLFGLSPGTGTGAGGITSTGPIRNGDGTTTAPSYSFSSDVTTGIYHPFASQIWVGVTATPVVRILASQIQMASTIPIGWNSAADFLGSNDTYMSRGAAGVVCVGTSSTVGNTTGSLALANVQIRSAANASLGNVGGCIFDHIADVSSTSTDGTLDTIYTDTIVANALSANSKKITFEYLLTVVSSATATRRIVVTFASVTILDSTALTYASTGTVRIVGTIWRVSSTTCLASVRFDPSGSSTILAFGKTTKTPPTTLTGLTLSGTNVLALTAAAAGTGAASADIVGNGGVGFVIPAGS